ncbi:fucose 4-O-acetylase-like acetyltransferase [Georgenia soli]|uniref:Fucose 4-O-acetylase-like acetyltransferase n=1 Tax=Georgenia soli TaxID=638953 RepID=A0A2A9EMH0_9MICO|nr:acyltransferase [Georgenia soli]PFG40164.1 fucose 4-O-acetylase-like acetyltransferase [Georgenia soli]
MVVGTRPERREQRPRRVPRDAWADNLRTLLVAGVVLAHAVIAWTGVGNWVLTTTPVRDPLLTFLLLLSLVGSFFGMALFFWIAGLYSAPSLRRKGPRAFFRDRLVRLGVPLLLFVLLLAPFVEYVDSSNAGWDQGFWALTLTVVWVPPLSGLMLPPAWGPTWFLAVLLVLSAGYATVRAVLPRPERVSTLRGRHLAGVGVLVAGASFLVRLGVPLGDEWLRLPLPQAPAWVAGFTLGVVGAERGWFHDPVLARRAGRVACVAAGATAIVIAVSSRTGTDIALFAGGGTWQSLVAAALEAVLVVTVPVWLIDVFRRRADHQGPLAREAGRAAYAAFLLHQPVLVGLVLASQHVAWPPEVSFLVVSAAAVAGSFALGALVVRLPGASRVI